MGEVMEIVLKDIYVGPDAMNFQASLVVNGCKAGVVTSEGREGSIQYHPAGDKGVVLIRDAEGWCRTLGPVVSQEVMVGGKAMTIPMDLDRYLENIIAAWRSRKDLERFRYRVDKAMWRAIVFGIPDKTFTAVRCPMPVDDLVRYGKGVERLKRDIHRLVLPVLKEGEKILNTNIPGSVISKLGVDRDRWVEMNG